ARGQRGVLAFLWRRAAAHHRQVCRMDPARRNTGGCLPDRWPAGAVDSGADHKGRKRCEEHQGCEGNHMSYEFFSDAELTCKCGCGQQKMQPEFMAKLVELRRKCGFPFPVSSAYRCPTHNNRVSRSGLTGAHTTGRAIDVAVQGSQALKLLREATAMGFT